MAKQKSGENGHDEQVASYEQELADYLEKRLKPGLNRGAIPLVARSIAKEIARDEYPDRVFEDAEEDEKPGADDAGAEAPDLETSLRELQAKLGEDWVLYFSVHGDDTWLTAEKQDASQRLEAPTGEVLLKAVTVLSDAGG
jgi:hypothetical protein